MLPTGYPCVTLKNFSPFGAAVWPAICQERLDRFASNLNWGTRKVLFPVKAKVLN